MRDKKIVQVVEKANQRPEDPHKYEKENLNLFFTFILIFTLICAWNWTLQLCIIDELALLKCLRWVRKMPHCTSDCVSKCGLVYVLAGLMPIPSNWWKVDILGAWNGVSKCHVYTCIWAGTSIYKRPCSSSSSLSRVQMCSSHYEKFTNIKIA